MDAAIVAGSSAARELPQFERRFFRAPHSLTRLGDGELGGKAGGLVLANSILAELAGSARPSQIDIRVPRMVVLATGLFDTFIERNRLREFVETEPPDDRVAHAFRAADLPAELLGDLRSIVEETQLPLAVRSSSLLEDRLERPFAGIYGTKMTPNNQPDADLRFRRLIEAIKFVYASTYFRAARDYARAAGSPGGEKMAVIVQEVVGRRHDTRFYPEISGVARSLNYYPAGGTRPAEGVVSLALGLGKTIVDGGVCWSYSPRQPASPPPFASTGDLVRNSQTRFWAVNMGRPPEFDPMAEAEYMLESGLEAAEYDGSLTRIVSTYDAAWDQMRPGMHGPGARVLDFAPLLRLGVLPLNDAVAGLLEACAQRTGGAVEIEFALTIEEGATPRGQLGFLQVRPLAVSGERVDIAPEELTDPALLATSRRVMGNGTDESIRDVVYVPPERFRRDSTRRIAAEVAALNRTLTAEGRPYLLAGFGRWGSSDPWLGIPVEWAGISGARVIIEASLPDFDVEPSQGSHFFHNLSSFKVNYFMVHHSARPPIHWAWLAARRVASETEFLRHVVLDEPLYVKVDGREAKGLIRTCVPPRAVKHETA